MIVCLLLQDAHSCILDYGDDISLFAVYDGHGGMF
jgi:serine/threonine protein phosphatase PrpC